MCTSPQVSRIQSKRPDRQRTNAGRRKCELAIADMQLLRKPHHLGCLQLGQFGQVHLFHEQTHPGSNQMTQLKHKSGGQALAVKMCDKGACTRQRQLAERECKVLSNVDHPFIVRLRGCLQDDMTVYLAMDYCPGGDLYTHLAALGSLPERAALVIAAEIVLALDHLHSRDIVFRDLKPENVLLGADGHVQLCDFGLAKWLAEGHQGALSLCGTWGYISPEVLMGHGSRTSVDWWSLGVLLYEMMVGKLPFPTTEPATVQDLQRNCLMLMQPVVIPKFVTAVAADFVTSLLNPNVDARLGSWGVNEIKSHKFFASMSWTQLLAKRVKPPFNPCDSKNRTAWSFPRS